MQLSALLLNGHIELQLNCTSRIVHDYCMPINAFVEVRSLVCVSENLVKSDAMTM